VLVLVGEPGAGKTTLAEAAAHLATAVGITTTWGRCLDAASTPAYWPWSQVLRALPDGPRVRAARQRLDGDIVGDADIAGAGEDSVRQFRAYEAVAAALGEATADAPVLAVVDDLHAADDASQPGISRAPRELGRGLRL
jgi:predicted ATPase